MRPVAAGVRKDSPAGRIASWASWAFLTFDWKTRGWAGRYSSPKSSRTCWRAARTADSDSVTESVRM